MTNCLTPLSKRNIDVAINWAGNGFKVFPTGEGGENYKQPLSFIKWGKDATTDINAINKWWNKYPNATVSLSLKDGRFIVIDCDVKSGENGVNNFTKMLIEHSVNIDKIFQSRTPSGGRHFYFKLPDHIATLSNHRGRLPDNVEVKGNTSCILARGSVTTDGKCYLNDTNSDLNINNTLTLPTWLIDILTPPPPQSYVAPIMPLGNAIEYVKSAIAFECDNIRLSSIGCRNNTLNSSSFSIGTLVGANLLSYSEAENHLLQAALSINLTKIESLKTIKSGLLSGIKQPRVMKNNEYNDLNDFVITPNEKESLKLDYLDYIEEKDVFFDVEPLNINSRLINNLMNYLTQKAIYIHPNLALGSILATLSTLIGREVYTPTGASVGLYVLLISESGTGKGSYIKSPFSILTKIGLEDLMGCTDFSSSAYIEQVIGKKIVSLSCIDEFDTFLRKISSKKASHLEDAMNATLKSLWSVEFGDFFLSKGSLVRPSKKYQTPVFNILGAVTPKALFSSINVESIASGLINRFLFFPTSSKVKKGEQDIRPNTPLPVEVATELQRMYNLTTFSNQKLEEEPCQPKIIPWEENTNPQKIYREFDDQISNISNEEDRDLFVRLPELSLRIATIIAVSRDFSKAKITASDIKNAINIVKISGNYLHKGAQKYISENNTQAYTKKILEIIKQNKNNKTTKSQIIRKTQMIRKRERDEIIHDLAESKQIIVFEEMGDGTKKIQTFKYNSEGF